MEGCIPDKQRTIQTTSNVFQTIQLTRNISKDDKQYFSEITPWRGTSKLYRQLCYTSKDKERTGRTED